MYSGQECVFFWVSENTAIGFGCALKRMRGGVAMATNETWCGLFAVWKPPRTRYASWYYCFTYYYSQLDCRHSIPSRTCFWCGGQQDSSANFQNCCDICNLHLKYIDILFPSSTSLSNCIVCWEWYIITVSNAMISTRKAPCSRCISVVHACFSLLLRTCYSGQNSGVMETRCPRLLFFGWESRNHDAPPVMGRVNKRVRTGTVLAGKWTIVRFLHLVLAEDWRVQK